MQVLLVAIHEIIETYWNVNVFRLIEIAISVPEIIETYWNVNPDGFCFIISESLK